MLLLVLSVVAEDDELCVCVLCVDWRRRGREEEVEEKEEESVRLVRWFLGVG